MANINGTPPIPAGYFHKSDDLEKTGTAVRSSFNPSPLNVLTNRFARGGHPKAAKFADNVRSIGLKMRQSVNNSRLDGARARFTALNVPANAGTETLGAARASVGRLEHKATRLDLKQDLGKAAQAGNLRDAQQTATGVLQAGLAEKGYVPLEGLSGVAHASEEATYVVLKDDGHRVKLTSERPPLLARWIAKSRSAAYDRGSSGAGRALRSTVQHALVAVYSAEQSIKGRSAKGLAGSGMLDTGAQVRMNMRAARTGQKRSMLQASFMGNAELNKAYGEVLDKQVSDIEDLLGTPDRPRYEMRTAVNGIKPPQTRFLERRVDAYYKARIEASTAAAAEPAPATAPDAPPAPRTYKAGAIARFAVGVSNLRGKASLVVHAAIARDANGKAERAKDPAAVERYEDRALRHEAGAAKWQHNVTVRRSILQGQMVATLQDAKTRALMDQASPPPQVDDAADDDDLYGA